MLVVLIRPAPVGLVRMSRREEARNKRLSEKLSRWLVNELERRRFKVKAIEVVPDEFGISIELRVEPY